MAIKNLISSNEPPWFIKDLNSYFAKKAANNERANDFGFFSPSKITQCARLNMYVFLGVAPLPNPDLASIRRMMRGTAHHAIWYDIFRDAGLNVRGGDNKETTVSMENPTVAGHYDWIVTDANKLDWLIEWKSSVGVGKPSWEQNVQWTLYSVMTGIPRGFLVKENPADWQLTVFPMLRDDQFANSILNWLCMTEKHALERVMLDRDENCGKGRKWKESCDIFQFCHSDDGENPWRLCDGRK